MKIFSLTVKEYLWLDTKEGDLAYYTICTISNATDATLKCNAEEADTRMWLHASKAREKILVYSPDAGALFISLLMVNPIVKDVCLQVNPLGKPKQVLSITQLIEALKNNPYLRCIPGEDRPASLASLYILSGCDYTPFSVGYRKASFFLKHSLIMHHSSQQIPPRHQDHWQD